MQRYILVHYGEIGLKKENISYFIEKLKKQLKINLEKAFRENFPINFTLGRLVVKLPEDFDIGEHENKCAEVVGRVFGIRNFRFVQTSSTDLRVLEKDIVENLPKDVLAQENAPKTFRVNVKRSMILPYKSTDAEREIGSYLLANGLSMKVNLSNPEFIVDVELFNRTAYFSYKRYEGAGGLSANSQSKLVALLSSGIDSPVAAYKMMRRGARVIFVHFHGYPYTDKDEMEQVKNLVKILGEYQFDTKLYLVPFGQIQRDIATNLEIPGKVRTILYRRGMMRIAQEIARKEKAKGLVTGDSFGQVASQTPENIFAIHDATSIPVFQPLIAYDKEEIVKVAESIGTYEISKLPCKDTCTMFMPRKPELKAKVSEIRDYEKLLPLDEWVAKALAESEILEF